MTRLVVAVMLFLIPMSFAESVVHIPPATKQSFLVDDGSHGTPEFRVIDPLDYRSLKENWTFQHKKSHHKHAKGLKKHSVTRLELPRKATTEEVVPRVGSTMSCATPVENQGECGSCWDFSLTGTLRDTLNCQAKDPGRLSFNYLLDCATTESGCNGGDFDAADFLKVPKGPPSWSSWPYEGVQGACQHLPVEASAIDWSMAGTGLTASFRDIANVIGNKHQPVASEVAADEAWESYDGGVYNACDADASQIDHMIMIVAYDCETSVDDKGNCVFDDNGNLPPGVGTFTVKNSWGTTWGEKGFMRSKATGKDGQKCNALGEEALYFTVKSEPPKPPVVQPDSHQDDYLKVFALLALSFFFGTLLGEVVFALIKKIL